jgi:hypothetical protein
MQASTSSFPVATVLTIVFVVLKLTDTISWSWWWVLSPLWISFLLFGVLALIVLAIGLTIKNRW